MTKSVSIKMFFAGNVLCSLKLSKLKTGGQTNQRHRKVTKLKSEIQANNQPLSSSALTVFHFWDSDIYFLRVSFSTFEEFLSQSYVFCRCI